jgi:hypothetical protein
MSISLEVFIGVRKRNIYVLVKQKWLYNVKKYITKNLRLKKQQEQLHLHEVTSMYLSSR